MKKNQNINFSLRRLLLATLVAGPLATLPAPLWALPSTGANLSSSAGSATIATSVGTTLSISTPDRSVLSWTNFGSGADTIASGDTILYNLPTSTASVLNVVTGTGSTTINGSISSNGNVFILNQNGIIVQPGTSNDKIQVANLGLSTIPEASFIFANTGSLTYAGNTATNGIALTGANINVTNNGTVTLAGKTVAIDGTINAGQLNIIAQANTGTAATLGNSGLLTVGTTGNSTYGGNGNVTVTTSGGNVSLAPGGNVVIYGSANITSNGGNITQTTNTVSVGSTTANGTLSLNAGAGGIQIPGALGSGLNGNGKTLLLTAVAGNNTVITNAGTTDLNLQTSTINGTLSLTNTGGSILSGGNSTVSGNISLSASALDKNIVFAGTGNLTFQAISASPTAGSNVTLTSTGGSISLPSITVAKLTVTAATDITQQTGTTISNLSTTPGVVGVNLTSGKVTGISSVGNALWAAAPAAAPTVSLTGGAGSGAVIPVTVSTGGVLVATTSTSATPPLVPGSGYTSSPVASLTGGTQLLGNTGSSTFDAQTGSINLTASANDISNLVLKDAPNGATVKTVNTTTLASGTNATGNVTLNSTTGGLALGANSGDTVKVAGNLQLTAATAITEGSDNVTVLGSANLTAANAITLAGKSGNGVGLKNQYGQITANSSGGGDITVFEQTTLNLGNITTTGNLIAYSSAGNVINSGTLAVTGNVVFGAGTAAAPGDITIVNNTTANTLASGASKSIYILDDNDLLNSTLPWNATLVGNYLARNVSITNNSSFTLASINSTYGTGIAGNLSLTYTGAVTGGGTNGINILGGNVVVGGGVVTLSSTDAIVVTGNSTVPAALTASTVNVATASGNVSVNMTGPSTINATLVQPGSGTPAAAFTSNDTLTIGTINSNYNGSVSFNSGNKKDIKDSVTGGIQIFGPATFASAGNVTISKGGDNAGAVTLTSGNNGSITYVESGTVNIAKIAVNGTGTLVVTSQNGDIIDNASSAGVVTGNSTKTASFTASNGNVFLADPVAGKNNIQGTFNATAAGNVTLVQKNNVILGNVTAANGFLVVDTSAASGKTITQATNAADYVYGQLALVTNNADITVTNNGNRFGAYYIAAGTGNVSVTEDTTVNVQSIATTGNLTLTSNTGNIIDSAAPSLTLVDTFGNVTHNLTFGANAITASANPAVFTANSGNITLALPGSVYGAVSLNSGGNAAITSNNTTNGTALTLGATTVGGNLSVTNLSLGGDINQTGIIKSFGPTSFVTTGNATISNGAVVLGSNGNSFGPIQFIAGSGISGTHSTVINETTDFVLRAGSVSTANVTINTGGNFTTGGVGGSSITAALSVSAVGTITFGTGSLLDTGGVTVFSNNTKDLSQLSLSGNLASKSPVNLGTGTYLAPAP